MGLLITLLVQGLFVLRHDDVTSLLHVGAASEIRQFIESELDNLVLWEGLGHDGRFSYAIAREPTPPGAPGMDEPVYRYRRYFYSLLSGGFGTFPPSVTVWGLILFAAVGVGLVAAAGTEVARSLGIGSWSVVAGLTNLGAYNSALQLTSDALAFGFTLGGVALWLRDRRGMAIAAFVLGVWTKEVYLLLPLGLALWEVSRRNYGRAGLVAVIPSTFVLAWSSILIGFFPESSATNDSFVVPFTGIVHAFEMSRSGFSLGSQIFTWVVLATALLANALLRERLLLSLTVPWVALALVSHEQVWYHDSIRAFAPVLTLATCGLLLATLRTPSRGNRPSHPGTTDPTAASPASRDSQS